jgi:hypothetical protein
MTGPLAHHESQQPIRHIHHLLDPLPLRKPPDRRIPLRRLDQHLLIRIPRHAGPRSRLPAHLDHHLDTILDREPLLPLGQLRIEHRRVLSQPFPPLLGEAWAKGAG